MRVATDKLSVNSFVKEKKSGVKKLFCACFYHLLLHLLNISHLISALARLAEEWNGRVFALSQAVNFQGRKVILRVYFLQLFHSSVTSVVRCERARGRFEIQNSIFNLKNFTSNCHIVCMLSTQRHFKWVEHFFTWAQSWIFFIFHRSLHQAHAYIPTSCHLSLVD